MTPTQQLATRELPVPLSQPVFRVMAEVGSGSLTVRIVAHQFATALLARRPDAIGILSGTGMIAPW